MLIDHANKTVIHGARVLAVEELLDCATPEQRFDRIEAFIDQRVTLKSKKQKRKGVPFKKSSKLNPVKSLQRKSYNVLG